MYQIPVGNVEKIRKARKAVKNILSEIGLEDCQSQLKELNENPEKNSDEDEAFKETDWVDITEGYSTRQRKKWPYRSRTVCCSLCKYATSNLYNFRGHIARCHSFAKSLCTLVPCSQCHFISHPKIVKKHMLFFHSKVPTSVMQPLKESSTLTHRGNERYQCRKCGYPSSFIFAIKKHIILKHLQVLAEQYVGYRMHHQGNTSTKIYCCKVCKVNTGTLDQMLHHITMDPVHFSVSTEVQSYITENKNYNLTQNPTSNKNGLFVSFPSITPKPQTPQIFANNSLILQSNGRPGTLLAVQQLQGSTNSATLICTPGTNQAFLPPQASALVQLASAEAKGLLQPGATIALRSALPTQGSSSVLQIPTVSNVSLKQALSTTTTQPQLQQTPQAQQIILPPGMQSSASGTGTVAKPTKHVALQGTMLTSQSLLSHLIPTGNKVNGMPTYTFAPLQATIPVSQRTTTPLQPVDQTSNSAPQTKKWITCPLCNELFPSNVYDMHTEAAHHTKSSTKSVSLAARAGSLKKMPDKTVKCLTCKVLLSEKTVFQHLLHGLGCLNCSALFFSIKQLLDHMQLHNPSSKTYNDFLKTKYRVYTKGNGDILFPYIDVNTTAPREVLGDTEVRLALVTNSLDLIYFKLQPSNQQEICPAPVKLNSMYCPFCDEKFQHHSDHVQHLKQKHFVAPTIHAILKTEAFKCIYCNGVYTGKVTQQAVMLHIQRCRCSPKPPQLPKPTPVIQQQPPPKPPQQITQTPGLYFVPVPQGLTMTRTLAPARVITAARPPEPPVSEAELQSKKRLEAALKEAMEANKREREEKAAMRKKREQDKLLQEKMQKEKLLLQKEKLLLQPEPEVQSDPTVKLVLEPTSVERRCNEERRDFISKYFNVNPYATKSETEELCRRLSLTKAELAAHFGNKRSKCMKSLKRNSAAILLGFNMAELSKVKHNLFVPEQQPPPADTAESQQSDEEESPPPPSTNEENQAGAAESEPEPMDVSEAEKVSEEEPVQPMQ